MLREDMTSTEHMQEPSQYGGALGIQGVFSKIFREIKYFIIIFILILSISR